MKVNPFFSFILILTMLFSFSSIPESVVSGSAPALNIEQGMIKPGVVADSAVMQAALPYVKKIPDAVDVYAGNLMGFMLMITNTTAEPMTNVVLIDQLDPNAGWTANNNACTIDDAGLLTCMFGTLPAGWTYQVHISATTTPAMCGTLTNIATVSSDQNDPVSVTATINIHCQADVTITKTEERPSIVAGETVRFALEVQSIGTGAAEDVVVQDALPNTAGLVWSVDSIEGTGDCQITGSDLTCHFGTMAPGESRRVIISSPTTAAECGDITNTASVSAANEDPTMIENDTDSGTVTVYCTTLVVEKIADAETVDANDPVGFTITVTNSDSMTARSVTLTDVMPAGIAWSEDRPECAISGGVLSCSFGDLADGASASVHVSGISNSNVCGTMDNTAVAQAANVASPVQDTASVLVRCAPKLSMTKVAEQQTVPAGAPVSYVIMVNNIGSAPANDVSLRDPLPAGGGLVWSFDNVSAGGECSIAAGVLTCTFGTLPAGQSAGVRVTAVSNPQVCGFLLNTATAESSNAGIVSDITQAQIVCGANVMVTKEAERAEIIAGNSSQPARFIITVSSNGESTATGVTLSDPLPGLNGLRWSIDSVVGGGSCEISAGTLTCNFGSLAPGQSRTVIVTAFTGLAQFCVPGRDRTIPNLATVSATNEAADASSDNTAFASINVLCAGAVCEAPDEEYANDFNSASPGPDFWSSYPISTSPNGTQTFLGEFSNGELRFTYPDTHPEGHHMIRVAFDLYILRSWDGSMVGKIPGPDNWQFSVLNEAGAVQKMLVDTTFTNFFVPPYSFLQAYPGIYPYALFPGITGATAHNSMGYQFYGPHDSTYRMIFYIPHTEDTVRLSFKAFGLQVIEDESWGIDNFELRLVRCNTEYTLLNNLYFPLIVQDVQPRPLVIWRESLPEIAQR